TQAAGNRIDEAAFHAVPAQDELALPAYHSPLQVGVAQNDRFDFATRVPGLEMLAPVHLETTVRTFKRRNTHPAFGKPRHPGGVRTELRPAAASQRKNRCLGPHVHRAGRRIEDQCAVVCPPAPAMTYPELHA